MSARKLRKEWNEADHPREPAGSPEGGQFAGGGGGGASGSEGGGGGGPKLDPAVVNVGGDKWNKDTATRLEREYQDAKPAMDKITSEAVGKSEAAASDPYEEDAPGFIPETWDQMSGSQQEQAEQKYKEYYEHDYYQSEVDNWYSEQAPDDARVKVADDFNDGSEVDWAHSALEKLVDDRGKPFPFSNDDILTALEIKYEPYGGGGSTNDPEFEWNDTELNKPVGYDPAQQTLPGIEALKPEDYLTQDMREEIEKALDKAFNKEADDKAGSMDPPEYLADSAKEFLDESFSQMDDDDKFKFVEDHTDIIKDAEAESGGSGGGEQLTVDKLPEEYDPLNQKSGDDYRRTQALARYLSLERATQVLQARNLPVPSRDELRRIDNELWGGWKSSSTSTEGKLLQVAAAEELGGRLNAETRSLIDAAGMKLAANNNYSSIGGYDGVKAYLRAKWETTQYLLEKADIKTLDLYRGVALDKEVIDKWLEIIARHMQNAQEVAVPYSTGDGETIYKYLPTLDIKRNGALSTTTDPSVANDWSSASERIVLRFEAPRTAAISVPAYGINIHSEREVVIGGLAYTGWDAWRSHAPPIDKVPVKHHETVT